MVDAGFAELSLYGRFAFTANDGRDIAPKSAKAQALIALLATSDAGGRGRLWLQKRLWPTSNTDRAATSLRQALSEIRRAFGPDRDLLVSNRRSVSLDLDQVRVRPARQGEEFLEGLDISRLDHALGGWLEARRTGTANVGASRPRAATPSPSRPVVAFRGLGRKGEDFEIVEDIFIDRIARSLKEIMRVDVHLSDIDSAPDCAYRVDVQVFRQEDTHIGLRARINHGHPTELIWSGMTSTRLRGAPPVEDMEIVSLGNQLVDALSDAIAGSADETAALSDPNALIRRAIRRLGSRTPDALTEADALLERAISEGAGAFAAAWRSQIRLVQCTEGEPRVHTRLAGESRRLVADALDREPQNALVQAAAANVHLVLDRDVATGSGFARRAVSLNPTNPVAWNCLAVAKCLAGDVGEAKALTERVRRMGLGAASGHWWDFGWCLTAALAASRTGLRAGLKDAMRPPSPDASLPPVATRATPDPLTATG